MRSTSLAWVLVPAVLTAACTVRSSPPIDAGTGFPDIGPLPDGGVDAPRPDSPITLDPDAACAAAASVPAAVVRPVDVIWVVDNSTSMEPAIMEVRAGINAFADSLYDSGLDYRMIMLSRRTPTSGRLAICVPEPLAGPGCADGERFFQIDFDIPSEQPLEVVLGTLGETTNYTNQLGGGDPAGWRDLLRPGAHRTFVVVSDHNQRTCDRFDGGSGCTSGRPRLTETSLEDFPGGLHPFSTGTRALGPGILTAEYGDLFEGYTFDAIYGWGSETDPDATCMYGDGTSPPSPGYTYTTLVARTGGVRAQICSDSSAWDAFFVAVAGGVVESAPLACNVAVPPPPDGMFFLSGLVNVFVRDASGSTRIGAVTNEAACDPTLGGWYYDDPISPTEIILCPTSCDFARDTVRDPATSGLDVQFGCDSVPI